jgi:hypothetical protein
MASKNAAKSRILFVKGKMKGLKEHIQYGDRGKNQVEPPKTR